jgi:hypothetical protein
MRQVKPRDQSAKRVFAKLPVIEAEAALYVPTLPIDVRNADAASPAHCFIAEACRRQFGSLYVWIGRKYAYIDLPAEDGRKRHIVRFAVPPETAKAEGKFDKTGTLKNPGTYRFDAPKPGETLDAQRARKPRDPTIAPVKRKAKRRTPTGKPGEIGKLRSSGAGKLRFSQPSTMNGG